MTSSGSSAIYASDRAQLTNQLNSPPLSCESTSERAIYQGSSRSEGHGRDEGDVGLDEYLIGATSGMLATIPMTAVMGAGYAALPWREQYSMPPRQITMKIANKAGVAESMGEAERTAATAVAHFGYGAAMGCAYAAMAREPEQQNATTGIVFGLSVWAGSYLGLLPATGLMTSAVNHPVRRSLMMIGAHVVWGAALGYGTHHLNRIWKERTA